MSYAKVYHLQLGEQSEWGRGEIFYLIHSDLCHIFHAGIYQLWTVLHTDIKRDTAVSTIIVYTFEVITNTTAIF